MINVFAPLLLLRSGSSPPAITPMYAFAPMLLLGAGASNATGAPTPMRAFAPMLLFGAGATATSPPPATPRYAFAPMLLFSSGGGSPAIAPVFPYFERDLLAYLNGFGFKVYPGHIPQGATLPALTFFIVGGDHLNRLGGAAGIVNKRVQIAVSSTSYIDCAVISEQVRSKLQGYIQKLMGQTYIFSVTLGTEVTQYEQSVDASDKGTHAKISEFTFIYQESIPTP
jgi:hypothetical protein